MTTNLSVSTSTNDYIVQTEVVKIYDENDIHNLGKSLDGAMAKLATGNFCRDEVTLAYLTTVESVAHLIGWRNMKHDALTWPVLDKIISQYPNNKQADNPTLANLDEVKTWVRVSEDYYSVITSILNALKKRMKVSDVKQGWTVFYPDSNFDAEKRNRWFKLRWDAKSEQAGSGLLKDDTYTRSCVVSIDLEIKRQIETTTPWDGSYKYPKRDWYKKCCQALATQALTGQFEHIDINEVWGGLTKDKILLALQPLYLRAAMRYFGHIRLFKYLREVESAQAPVSLSAIEVATLADLAQEISQTAGISQPQARSFLDGLIRRGKEENYSVQAYPLLPLYADRIAFLPSAVLFGNWPLIKQQPVASQIHQLRDQRQTNRVLEVFSKRGFTKLDTNLELKNLATGSALTDLDVVVVSDSAQEVLVLQLKSFIVNSSLLKIDKADGYVSDGVRQCGIADSNLTIVKQAIETKFRLSLPTDWTLKQMIVVEHNSGTSAPSPIYPAITIEWLESEVRDKATFHSLTEIWQAGIALPDGKEFFSSIGLAFELTANSHLLSGKKFATFAYAAK